MGNIKIYLITTNTNIQILYDIDTIFQNIGLYETDVMNIGKIVSTL